MTTDKRTHDPLIAQLTEDLEPVRPMGLRQGLLMLVVALAVTLVGAEHLVGFWRAGFAGEATAMFWVANGLLAVLGIASATAVVRMAGPQVGNRYEGPSWLLAALGVLPLTAIALIANGEEDGMKQLMNHGFDCMLSGLAGGSIVAVALVIWLRRGAPVSIEKAGFYTGVAAGALGSFSYGLTCSLDGMIHLGIAHVMPVVIGGVVGWFAVPPLIRW